jgi:alpha-1,2-glucosyltransferase
MLAVVVVAGAAAMWPLPVIVDEGAHSGMILASIRGELDADFGVTTPTLLHRLIAWLAGWTRPSEPPDLRPWLLPFALTAWWAAWHLARVAHDDAVRARVRLLQFVCLPIALPYTFLIYTDLPALAGVLAAVAAAQGGRDVGAATWVGVSMLVRQQNVVWAFVLAIRRMARLWRKSPRLTTLVRDRALWAYALVGVAFIVFVAWNGGIALGQDRDKHAPGLYRGNIEFVWLLGAFLLLPLVIARWREGWHALRHARWPGWLALVVTIAFVQALPADHPYNVGYLDVFLRNRILNWLQDPWHRLAVAPLLMFATASLATLRLRGGWTPWVVFGGALALAPSSLIEHRYAIPIVALVVILREPDAARTEWALLAWLASLSALALYVHAAMVWMF